MAALYAPEASFSDPIFTQLNGPQAGHMWTMILSARQDFSLTYAITQATDTEASVAWTARYRFAKTGRMIVNRVQAHLTIRNGLIVEHRDEFSLYGWARQAFGPTGILLGWMPWFQNRVRQTAQGSLERWVSSSGRSASQ